MINASLNSPPSSSQQELNFEVELGSAKAFFNGSDFEVSTGMVERKWIIGKRGFATVSLRRSDSSFDWIDHAPNEAYCDWHLRGVTDSSNAKLISSSVRKVVKNKRLNDHISCRFRFLYPDPGFYIDFEVRVWPESPGIWTRISLAPEKPFDPVKDADILPTFLGWSYSEQIAADLKSASINATGLYSDTQHRNFDHLPLLRSEPVAVPGEKQFKTVDWANLLSLQVNDEGLTLVKESPKCVNTPHVDTGEFVIEPNAVSVTGLGISDVSYASSTFWSFSDGLSCWANWIILHEGKESFRQLAIKRFDRARFPFRVERDGMVMANTWGSGGAFVVQGREGAPAATSEARLLSEIESCADLGIDLLQIDHGWNFPPESQVASKSKNPWKPDQERLPNGWKPIREAAELNSIHLGLWFSFTAALEDSESILENVRALDLRRLKLDFMTLHTVDDVDRFRRTLESLSVKLPEGTAINWDVTEGVPRVGYFYAREFGNLFLSNRENGPGPMRQGSHVQFTPRLQLRDTWQLAHVMNLNQLQITVQDKDATPTDYSNASAYPHDYSLAIALMGIPLFFQETQFLTEESRNAQRRILKIYRDVRNAIWSHYVFPIGDEPNDFSCCGFQSIDESLESGFITLFREIHSPEDIKDIPLHFVGGRTVTFTDLLTGETFDCVAAADSSCTFKLSAPGNYRWLTYQSKVSND